TQPRQRGKTESTSTSTPDDCPGSLEEKLEIGPERPLVYVPYIEAHHVVEGGAAAPLHLPEAREARLGFQHAASMPGVVAFEFVPDGRPRAHQGHASNEHVE